MVKNKEIKNQSILENDTLKSSDETVRILSDLGKEAMKTGEISQEITKADQESSSVYLSALKETLNAIKQEIKDCKDPDEKSMLYKQREDVMNRMKEEKENQRNFNDNREDKNRSHSKVIFGSIAAVALGAGGYVTKILLESKRA